MPLNSYMEKTYDFHGKLLIAWFWWVGVAKKDKAKENWGRKKKSRIQRLNDMNFCLTVIKWNKVGGYPLQ